MTQREVFFETVLFGRPERTLAGVPDYALRYLGSDHEDAQGVGHDRPVGEEWTDFWGVGWRKDLPGVMGFPRVHPLADITKVDDYVFPSADDLQRWAPIEQQKADYTARRPDLILSGSHRDTLWERAYMLVGMENLMVAFYDEPECVRRLLRGIMDFQLGMARHYLQAGIELACLGDDMGTQHGLLLGTALFDAFLLPEYKRLFDFYRDHGVLIHFHSCGHVQPLLGRLMDLGVNILNPVQASANDLPALRAVTQGRVTLHGGVNSDVVLTGTEEEVAACTRQRLMQLGAQGGYFCAPDQYLPYPEHNLQALRRTVMDCDLQRSNFHL